MAMAAGTSLGWLGLLMQTWFRNPLAGPGVLGITSGGSLGVALAVLLGLSIPAWMAASLGCFAVLLLIGVGARRFVSPVTTLVFGLMISYAVSAVVTVLQSSATAEALQTFVFWGMGTFGKASVSQATFCLALQAGLGIWMMRRSKWLDMWTLGEDLAQTMGVPKSRLHLEILLMTGLVLGRGDFGVRSAGIFGSCHASCVPLFSCQARPFGLHSRRWSVGCFAGIGGRRRGEVHRQHVHALAVECGSGHHGGACCLGGVVETNPRLVMNLQLHHLVLGHHPEASLTSEFSPNFNSGGMHVILGGNGSGKTTLLRSVLGIQSVLSGTIGLDDGENSLVVQRGGAWQKHMAYVASTPPRSGADGAGGARIVWVARGRASDASPSVAAVVDAKAFGVERRTKTASDGGSCHVAKPILDCAR